MTAPRPQPDGPPTLAGLYRDIIDTAGTPLMHVMVHAAAKLISEGRFDADPRTDRRPREARP